MGTNIDNIYFTPYRVSTITCNADMGNNLNINLNLLFENIKIDTIDDSFIWVQQLKEGEEKIRGIYPKKKRKSKIISDKKCRFDNQITTIYKSNENYKPNIKIFKNGNIQLTGVKDLLIPKKITDSIINNIVNIYNNIDKDILISGNISDLFYNNFKIRMINSDFKIYVNESMTERYNIKRKELHNILISSKYNNKCSFQPGIYQGVKLEYYWNSNNQNNDGICHCNGNCFGKNSGHGESNCKKVTVAIFESGSILITGGITFQQVDDAYKYICNIIKENKNKLMKIVMLDIVI